ncbi:hypothetical protein ACH5RR_021298 [Cinchona calisaya]|uniref:Uncharacterized protein n=1 Tax=Cinchona calisaya TaxID=153742 RepID=A0ABD2ZHV9_9GENT
MEKHEDVKTKGPQESHVQCKSTRIGHNENDGFDVTMPPTLSVFNQPRRSIEKCKRRFLIDQEMDTGFLADTDGTYEEIDDDDLGCSTIVGKNVGTNKKKKSSTTNTSLFVPYPINNIGPPPMSFSMPPLNQPHTSVLFSMSHSMSQPPRSKSFDMPPHTSHLPMSMPFNIPPPRSQSPTFVPFSVSLPTS